MKPQDFIQSEGIARAARIAKAAPQWAVYYDAEKRCYEDVYCENCVILLELEDVVQGCGS